MVAAGLRRKVAGFLAMAAWDFAAAAVARGLRRIGRRCLLSACTSCDLARRCVASSSRAATSMSGHRCISDSRRLRRTPRNDWKPYNSIPLDRVTNP